jgi:F-box domain
MTKHNNSLLSLPNEILLMVAGNLTIWDQQCLALTCKHFSDVICQDEITTIHDVYQVEREAEEFFLRLQKDWVPKNLKWCRHCGKFQSREKDFWDDLAERYRIKVGGLINAAWRFSIDEHIFQTLVSKWCDPKALRINSAVKECPKCTISKSRMKRWGWDV